MRMHRVLHIPATIVPALLTLWLALAAPAATNNTVANFPSVIAFELGEGQKDVQGEASHGRVRVEMLGYRDESDLLFLEKLQDFYEIRKRTREPVYLINHHAVDLLLPDVVQELLQGRAVRVGSRKASVVIGFFQEDPPLMLLALDIAF